MGQTVIPMIHVPDVRATTDWYTSIGFQLRDKAIEEGEMTWAALTFGNSEIMLNCGGKPSDAHRRELDLYIRAENVEALCQSMKKHIDLLEDVHDTHYGMREFIVRDLNGFWITFGQPIPE